MLDGDGRARLALDAVGVGINDLDRDIDRRLDAGAVGAVGQAVYLKGGHIPLGRGAFGADKGERICRICGDGVRNGEDDAVALALADAGVEHPLRLQAHLFAQAAGGIAADRPGAFIRLEIGIKGHIDLRTFKIRESAGRRTKRRASLFYYMKAAVPKLPTGNRCLGAVREAEAAQSGAAAPKLPTGRSPACGAASPAAQGHSPVPDGEGPFFRGGRRTHTRCVG